jgi:hypothetical protein
MQSAKGGLFVGKLLLDSLQARSQPEVLMTRMNSKAICANCTHASKITFI